MAKSEASAPVIVGIGVMATGSLPKSVIVVDWAALAVLTIWAGNTIEAVERVTARRSGVAMPATLRTRALFASAMIKFPRRPIVSPEGELNLAQAAGPPTPQNPSTPLPATV